MLIENMESVRFEMRDTNFDLKSLSSTTKPPFIEKRGAIYGISISKIVHSNLNRCTHTIFYHSTKTKKTNVKGQGRCM